MSRSQSSSDLRRSAVILLECILLLQANIVVDIREHALVE
jgi:hypothetical protein